MDEKFTFPFSPTASIRASLASAGIITIVPHNTPKRMSVAVPRVLLSCSKNGNTPSAFTSFSVPTAFSYSFFVFFFSFISFFFFFFLFSSNFFSSSF